MTDHPAIAPGRVAVVTGAASGIGLAAAKAFAKRGMKIVMADIDQAHVVSAADEVAEIAGGPQMVLSVATDVSDRDQVVRLYDRTMDYFGEVAVLMNNAGTEGGGELFGDPERWVRILSTNLLGVINGIQVFAPEMIRHGRDGAVISTGSKQGITCPPGDTAYNVSKAGVKVVTEALAHELRSTHGCKVTAHLLIPGFTFTGFTRQRGVVQKPPGAWTPEQVVEFMLPRIAARDFYILCPDNEVTREIDVKRIRWAAEDVVLNRPALSRWHPDYKDAFARWMES